MSAGPGTRASEDEALEALGRQWGTTYDIGTKDGRYYARRSDGTGGPLEGDTPDELDAAIRAAGNGQPVDGPLEELRHHWGSAYDIGYEYGRWVASRRDGQGGTITDPEPGGLRDKIAADYLASPVSRDLP